MRNLTSVSTATPATLGLGSPAAAGTWRDRGDAVAFALGSPAVRGTDAVAAHLSVHNSMQPTGAVSASAERIDRRVYAAKQAAPPRGRHR